MKFVIQFDTGGGKYLAGRYFDSLEDARSFVLGIIPEEWWLYASVRAIETSTSNWYDGAKKVAGYVWDEGKWSQVHDVQ